MERQETWDDLVAHLTRTTPLDVELARRIVADIVDALDEPVERVIRRRHRELQGRGLANAAIFDQIAQELRTRPVAAPPMTPRQIRRTIYG